MDSFTTVPVPQPVTSVSLYPLSSIWLVSDLLERLTWSKLSAPGCRCLTSISYTLGYEPWCRGGTNGSSVMGDCVGVWCVPSATHMSCIICKIQTEVLGIRGLVTLFSKTPLYMYVCIIYLFMYEYECQFWKQSCEIASVYPCQSFPKLSPVL